MSKHQEPKEIKTQAEAELTPPDISVAQLEHEDHSSEATTSTGKIIKMARIRAKLSLEKLSKITCIRLKYLQAIEDDNFNIIPEKVAARGFIKICCDHLGLNYALVLDQFSREHEKPREHKSVAINKIGDSNEFNKNYLWIAAAVICAVIVLLLIFRPGKIFTISSSGHKESVVEENTSRVVDSQDVVLTDKPSKRIDTDVVSNPPSTQVMTTVNNEGYIKLPVIVLTSSNNEIKKKINTRKASAKLTVRAVQDAWLAISIDGVEAFHDMIYKGETKTWTGKRSVTIRTPNPANVRINYNNQEYGNLSQENKIIERTFQDE